jgi:hypothetical protein
MLCAQVSYHAPAGSRLSLEQLKHVSAVQTVVRLLATSRSPVRVLLFCDYSLHSAQVYAATQTEWRQLAPGQLQATNRDEVVSRFLALQ